MTKQELFNFLQRHKLGVVATTASNGAPQAAVVGIATTDAGEVVTCDYARRGHASATIGPSLS